jgi:protein ImuA
MSIAATKPANDADNALTALRKTVARIEGFQADLGAAESRPLSFGVASLDRALAGGLAPAALHEITPAAMTDLGSAIGFALALAARSLTPQVGSIRLAESQNVPQVAYTRLAGAGRRVIWITTDFAALEAGGTYGLGCDLFGLAARDLLVVRVARASDALWAFEEALKCRALSCAVAELPNDAPAADLTATRRLTLAAREGGGFGFLLRHRGSALTSAAETRWRVAAHAATPDRFGGLGATSFCLTLHKNRRGPTGRWPLRWNHHERAFEALSLGVAAAAPDRQDRAPLQSAG